MKKRWMISLCAAVLAVLMAGCGSQQNAGMPATGAQQEAAQSDATQTNEQPAVTDQQAPNDKAAGAGATVISEDEAKAIALKAAGVNEKDATFTKVAREFDDGREKYEIEFVAGEQEYSYDIDAYNGDIIESERESIYDD